jgi:hypothetical protein
MTLMIRDILDYTRGDSGAAFRSSANRPTSPNCFARWWMKSSRTSDPAMVLIVADDQAILDAMIGHDGTALTPQSPSPNGMQRLASIVTSPSV